MQIKRWFLTALILTGAAWCAPAAVAADAVPLESWHAKTLVEALGYTALFGLTGVLLAVVGYKLFDFCTPGNLHKEILENKNVAAAIVAGAVIIGVCVIIAAAIMG
jgi:uncharacterized membrane protein YjfL (UPF0719 family)